MSQPADAVIAVTFQCNARCVMCNVWRSDAPDALRPHHMRKLPAGLRTVNLSGGEPFLRDDLPEFVREVRARCPKAKIAISTNGLLGDRIVATWPRIRRIDPSARLAVSLDGIGEAHDRVRGTQGAFGKVVDLLDRLGRGPRGGLRLGMTLTSSNLDQLPGVADFARRRGLELGLVAAHACKTHLGVETVSELPVTSELTAGLREVIGRWLRSARPKQWLRAHFAWYTYRYILGRPWRFRCRAGGDFFFVQADGTVHSCGVLGRAMGSLADDSWPAIWDGQAAGRARGAASQCRRNCWMICTARSVYRASPAAVTGWVLLHKPLAHLGLLRMPRGVWTDAEGHEGGIARAHPSR